MRPWKMTMIAVMVLAAAVACSNDVDSPGGGDTVVLRVIRSDDTIAEWTLDRLASEMPLTERELDGQTQKGFLLLDVLAASNIGSWEWAEVAGKGENRAFDVVLQIDAGEVDDGWILDVTHQGTLKLAADDLPRDRWVRDVSEIAVE